MRHSEVASTVVYTTPEARALYETAGRRLEGVTWESFVRYRASWPFRQRAPIDGLYGLLRRFVGMPRQGGCNYRRGVEDH